MVRRRFHVVLILVAVAVAGCADPNAASPPATSITAASGTDLRSSYVGSHWVATRVFVDGATHPMPSTSEVGVDFLPTGSVLFDDGVNAVSARWINGSGQVVHLDQVASTSVGYVGTDPTRSAAIHAVRQLTSPVEPDGTMQPASDVSLTVTGDALALTGNGASITYRRAGPSSPALTRSAVPTTPLAGATTTPAGPSTPGASTS